MPRRRLGPRAGAGREALCAAAPVGQATVSPKGQHQMKIMVTAFTGLLIIGSIADASKARADDTPMLLAGRPVALASYGVDTAATTADYASWWDSLPSLPPLILGVNTSGVVDAFDNVTGFLPWDFAFGLTLGNTGNLGIQAWDPSNPMFDFVAESVGTTSGAWPGVASLVGVLTPLGGFTNTESYGNFYDPTGTTCLICDTFSLLGPDNNPLFTWTIDIPIGARWEFELVTPLFSLGPDLGNAFDYSPLANGLPDAAAAMASGDSELASPGGMLTADLAAILPHALATDLATMLPHFLASLVP
jgi:hypothetical protein